MGSVEGDSGRDMEGKTGMWMSVFVLVDGLGCECNGRNRGVCLWRKRWVGREEQDSVWCV